MQLSDADVKEITIEYDASATSRDALGVAATDLGVGAELVNVCEAAEGAGDVEDSGPVNSAVTLSLTPPVTDPADQQRVLDAIRSLRGIAQVEFSPTVVPAITRRGAMHPTGSFLEVTLQGHPEVAPRGAEGRMRWVVDVLSDLGITAAVSQSSGGSSLSDTELMRQHTAQELRVWFRLLLISAFFTLPVFIIGMVMTWAAPMLALSWGSPEAVPGLWYRDIILLILSFPVQFGVGYRFYKGAWGSIRRGRCQLGMDFLIAAGTSAAYAASVLQMGLNVVAVREGGSGDAMTFFETSALLISFVTLGKLLEAVAKGHTSDALKDLLRLQVGGCCGALCAMCTPSMLGCLRVCRLEITELNIPLDIFLNCFGAAV